MRKSLLTQASLLLLILMVLISGCRRDDDQPDTLLIDGTDLVLTQNGESSAQPLSGNLISFSDQDGTYLLESEGACPATVRCEELMLSAPLNSLSFELNGKILTINTGTESITVDLTKGPVLICGDGRAANIYLPEEQMVQLNDAIGNGGIEVSSGECPTFNESLPAKLAGVGGIDIMIDPIIIDPPQVLQPYTNWWIDYGYEWAAISPGQLTPYQGSDAQTIASDSQQFPRDSVSTLPANTQVAYIHGAFFLFHNEQRAAIICNGATLRMTETNDGILVERLTNTSNQPILEGLPFN